MVSPLASRSDGAVSAADRLSGSNRCEAHVRLTTKTLDTDDTVRTELRARNRAIARAALGGETIVSVAGRWMISRARCHELVHSVCRRLDPELYRSLCQPNECRPRLATLREYLDAFTELLDDDGILTRHSSIRRIPTLPTMTLNALLREGVRTVQELAALDIAELGHVPVIGEEGLRRIQDALRSGEYMEQA